MIHYEKKDSTANFHEKIQEIVNDLKKCLGVEKTTKNKTLYLMVKPCEDRLDNYDLFATRNTDYNKTMGNKTSYSLYLDKSFILNGKKATDTSLVASFWLVQFPGCCGIALSTQASVLPEYRRKGIGTILNRLRIEIARDNGYTVLVCTAVDDEAMSKILLRNGWSETLGFTNKRTGNHVILYSIYL